MNKRYFALVCAAVPIAAMAQVTPIGPFTGGMQEGWETHALGQFNATLDIFGGAGSANALSGGQGLHVTTGWGFFATTFPHSGGQFMGGAGVNYELVFDSPALQFGAYFQTNADAPDATAAFFDANNVLIGSAVTVPVPIGQWQWSGWEYAQGISRIEIRANNQYGGFIMIDDLEYNAVPEPGAFVALAAGLALLVARRRK